MANYNTFAVVNSRHGKVLLITSSARKASEFLSVGKRIEVWNDNKKITSITCKTKFQISEFIQMEKDYIRKKQEKSTLKNKRRRNE